MTGLPMEMAKAACKATVSTLEGDDLDRDHRLRFVADALREDAAGALPRAHPERHPAHPARRRHRDLRRARHGVPGHLGGSGAEEARHPADRRPRTDTGAEGHRAGDDRRSDHADHGRPGRRHGCRAPAIARRPRRRPLSPRARPEQLAQDLHAGDRADRAPGRGRGVVPGAAGGQCGFLEGHRDQSGAAAPRLRGDADEAAARDLDPRERSRRADPGALARRASAGRWPGPAT